MQQCNKNEFKFPGDVRCRQGVATKDDLRQCGWSGRLLRHLLPGSAGGGRLPQTSLLLCSATTTLPIKYIFNFHRFHNVFRDNARRSSLPNYVAIEQHYMEYFLKNLITRVGGSCNSLGGREMGQFIRKTRPKNPNISRSFWGKTEYNPKNKN
jgi:hypothetical protein